MRKSDFDSRLLIFRSRQMSLMMMIALATIGFTILIVQGTENKIGWWAIGVPLCMLGGLFVLFPPTEEWEYKAWQGKPRKVEQHFDR